MVPAGNKAKRLSSVNHTTKTIHHHYHHLRHERVNTLSSRGPSACSDNETMGLLKVDLLTSRYYIINQKTF